MNISKWYKGRSATEKGALISGTFLVVIALLTIAHQRSDLAKDNKSLRTDLQKTEAQRDSLAQRIAPFEAIAAKSFPNEKDRERLDLLIRSIEELNTRYGSFELRRAHAIELQDKVSAYASTHQEKHDKKPTVTLMIPPVATDSSRRFLTQLREIVKKGDWEYTLRGDFLAEPQTRGLWVYQADPEKKGYNDQLRFWLETFTQFGLDVRPGLWLGELDPGQVIIVVYDPSYIR